jgi:hypothetical protein
LIGSVNSVKLLRGQTGDNARSNTLTSPAAGEVRSV